MTSWHDEMSTRITECFWRNVKCNHKIVCFGRTFSRFRTITKMNPSSQLSDDNLLRSIENLINICENASADLSRHRDKLNMILNDLNSIDFKYVQTLDIIKVSLQTQHLLDFTSISIEFHS